MRKEQTQSKHLKQPEPKKQRVRQSAEKEKRVRTGKTEEEPSIIDRLAMERQTEKAAEENRPVEKKAPKRERAPKAEKPHKEKKKAGKKVKAALIVVTVICCLVIGACIAAIVMGGNIANNGIIFPNVYVGSICVGNLTEEQAVEALNDAGWEESVSGELTAYLPTDIIMKVDVLKSGARRTSEQSAKLAVAYGRSTAIATFFAYVENMITPVDVDTEPNTVDQDYIASLVEEAQQQFAANTKGKGYAVDLEKQTVSMLKGAEGTGMVSEDIIAAVSQALLEGKTELTYELPETDVIVMPDFDALHEELFKEVADAYYDGETETVIEEVIGVDFSIEEAKSIWTAAEVGTEIVIPLTVTQPELTKEEYEKLLFRDLLGTMTTSLSGSTSNRINNVTLAAGKINGYIMAPGEQFSYNTTVGQRTKAAGFLEAGAYSSGQVVQEVGGGICQVSSTLYCAQLYAQLTTVDRTCHMFAVSYLPPSHDATVSWPGPDFKFENSRDFPIKIVAYVNEEDNTVTVEIWGTDVDGSYVELKYSYWTVYDTEYPEVAIGSGGKLYRVFYDKDGNFIKQETENYSTYDYHPEDIEWPEEKDNPGGDNPGGDTPGGDTPGGDTPGGDTPGGEGGEGGGTGGEGTGGEGGESGGGGENPGGGEQSQGE